MYYHASLFTGKNLDMTISIWKCLSYYGDSLNSTIRIFQDSVNLPDIFYGNIKFYGKSKSSECPHNCHTMEFQFFPMFDGQRSYKQCIMRSVVNFRIHRNVLSRFLVACNHTRPLHVHTVQTGRFLQTS